MALCWDTIASGLRLCPHAAATSVPRHTRVMRGVVVQVVKHVLRKAKETRVLRLRHCLRLLPCTHVVRSQPAEIDAAAKAAITMAIDCCTCP